MPYAGHYHSNAAFLRACLPLAGKRVTIITQDTDPTRGGKPATPRWQGVARRCVGPARIDEGRLIEINRNDHYVVIEIGQQHARVNVDVIRSIEKAYNGLPPLGEKMEGGGVHARYFHDDASFIKALRPLLDKNVEVAIGSGRPWDRYDRDARHEEPLRLLHGRLTSIGSRKIVVSSVPVAIPIISYVRETDPAPQSPPDNKRPDDHGWSGKDKR